MPPRSIDDYQVGWICALPIELATARAMLDEEHGPVPSQDAQDHNNYVLGQVHNHDVVIACMPAGVDGSNATAVVAVNMLRTFRGLRFGLMVGIGGGIPNLDKGVDIRLGDIVVSQHNKTQGGVVQYDKGKSLEGGQFERKGSLSKPPTLLLTALTSLQAQNELYGSQISASITRMIERHPYMKENGCTFPGVEQDCLYCADCKTTLDNSCDKCQDGKVHRKERRHTGPVVHYGIIASGNQVVKDSVVRDRLRDEFDAKCVEIEAFGLMDHFPCLVIRGVSDYADAHRNNLWQPYAATTAAAYAREFLSIVAPQAVSRVSNVSDVMKHNLGLNLFDAPDMDENLFIGREAEFQMMETILQPQSDSLGSNRKVLVLGGMGGIGKTQLAITFAKRHYHSYSSILWLNATTEVTLKNSLRAVANRILPPETASKLDDDQLLVRVSSWLSTPGNTRWLLIFDNHDDPDQYGITQYYPSIAHGSIIITTRQPALVNGDMVKVQSMDKIEESLLILAARSGRENVTSDPDARQLAERLDGHPLALATAGAFLSQSSLSFSKYLQLYESKWKIIYSFKELADYPSRTLCTTWNLSFMQIKQENVRAANLLRFLAYLDHQDIWYELLQGGQGRDQPAWFIELASDEFVFEDAMQTLARYSFVESHHETGSYSLHVLVHDWILNDLNHDIDPSQYWVAFDCVASHVSADDWDNLSALKYRRLTPHAVRLVVEQFQKVGSQQLWLQNRLSQTNVFARLLNQQVQYKAAERMYMRALVGKETALGRDQTSTLSTVNNLGLLYYDQGKLAEGKQMYLRALVGYEKALGRDHPSTLDTASQLANLYRAQGKLNEAEKLHLRALTGMEKALGPDHTSTLNTVNNLGLLYADQGRLEEAEQMFLRALAGQERELGAEHPSTLNTVNNLGLLYRHQGKLDEAEKMCLRALAGHETALGPDHPATLTTTNNLGLLYLDQGRLNEAEQMFLRALAGQERVLRAEHPSTLDTFKNLGLLYRHQDKLAEAEQVFLRALAGKEKELGAEHPSTFNIVNYVVDLYHDQGRLDDANKIFEQALAKKDEALRLESLIDDEESDDDVSEVSSGPPSLISDSTDASVQDKHNDVMEHLVEILCVEEMTGLMYRDAVENFRTDRFRHRHDQLLKIFFKDLRHEIRTENELATIRLLRTRACRHKVTSLILKFLQPFENSGESLLTATLLAERKTERNYNLNQMLRGFSVGSDPYNGQKKQHDGNKTHEDSASESSGSSTESEDEPVTQNEQSPLQAIDAFLTGGKAFAQLKVNLANLLRPPQSFEGALSSKSIFVVKQYISRNLAVMTSNEKEIVLELRAKGLSNAKIAENFIEKALVSPVADVGKTPRPTLTKNAMAAGEDLLKLEANLCNEQISAGETTPMQPALTDPAEPAKSQLHNRPQLVTWTCSCGVQLYDYYTEIVPGSLEQLQQQLQKENSPYLGVWHSFWSSFVARTTSRPSATHSNSGNQANATSKTQTTRLAQGNTEGGSANTPENTDTTFPASTLPNSVWNGTFNIIQSPQADPAVSYLLLCFPEGLSGLKLHHQQIMQAVSQNCLPNQVKNDRQLFRLLRKKYASERRLSISRFWPKTVIRVSLAYFMVDLSGYVELKHYACQDGRGDCKCIPPPDMIQPASNAQYHCVPKEPPLRPPIGASYLTHYFQNPDCITSEHLVYTLNQVPKRLGQCMAISGSARVEGWGMEFEEGWDRGRLRNAIFGIAVIGCLTFAILWSVFMKDMQSAFGVSSFFVTVLAVVGGYIASAEPRIVHK